MEIPFLMAKVHLHVHNQELNLRIIFRGRSQIDLPCFGNDLTQVGIKECSYSIWVVKLWKGRHY